MEFDRDQHDETSNNDDHGNDGGTDNDKDTADDNLIGYFKKSDDKANVEER